MLASFVRAEEFQFIPMIEQVCKSVYTVPIKRSRLADAGYLLRSLLSKRPFLIERDDRNGMHKVVQDVMKSARVDCIHADQLTMTQYALPYSERGLKDGSSIIKPNGKGIQWKRRPVLVFDAHNAVWTIVERMRGNLPRLFQPLAGLEAHRVKQYEGQLVSAFDHTLTVTENDRTELLQAAHSVNGRNVGEHHTGNLQDSITVAPIAVDTERIQPVSRQAGSKSILTLGSLHYPPNADGIRWFLKRVFPRIKESIPDTHLNIIGKNPPDDLVRLANDDSNSVTIAGYVPDLRPYLQSSAIVVIPVRAGSGMRVRILDAFAYGMPVVTTTVGLEGIEAIPGEHILVADTAQDFARNVINLLRNEDLQAKLSANGRSFVEKHYHFKIALRPLDRIYGEFNI